MSTITREQLSRQLNWRYATKNFDPQRKISPADWAALEESLVLTPSSFGLQPWKFVVVNSPALREKLADYRRRIRVVLPKLQAAHPELLLLASMFHHY